jgi:predicted ATP-binding protein involved in virulence
MEPNKTKFRQCPKCNGYIPETWETHEKCGWNVIKQTDHQDSMDKADRITLSVALRYATDLISAGKADIKDLEALHKRILALMQ